MKLEHLSARCFLCGTKQPVFDTASRVCECIRPQGFPASELACYVSVFPELRSYSVADLPSLWAAEPADIFAVAADSLGADPERITRQTTKAAGRRPEMFPYPADLLRTGHHARCGNANLYRSPNLEDLTGFERVWVLDMGSYYWSGTLKDPRSWAIVNTALACHMTDISVWTAGNAGVSLAKMAHFANRRLPREARLQVHAIVDNDVAPEIRSLLRLWQAEVLDVFRQDKPVLNPEEIRSLVAARLRRFRRHLDDTTYWDVTDGWDGVGLLMYRMIAAQIIRDVVAVAIDRDSQPLDIVLPVGTGDLLLGFHLGLRDCEEAGVVPRALCRLIGALPAGANILGNIRRSIPDDRHTQAASAPPVMPKLTSLYTPLAPCVARMEKEGAVYFIAVTEQDQLRAGRQILSAGIDGGIAAEPSALATFAALPYIDDRAKRWEGEKKSWAYQSSRRILIVNSGLGVLGHQEEGLLHRAIGM